MTRQSDRAESRPMNILDPRFRYVASHETDLRKTFARIRREARAASKPVVPRDKAPVSSIVKFEIPRKSVG